MPEFDETTLAVLVGATAAFVDFVTEHSHTDHPPQVIMLVGATKLLCSYLTTGVILPEYQGEYQALREIAEL